MKLNIGCGPFPQPGWVNVDRNQQDEPVDVVASVLDLPFDDDSAETIYAGHVLEHISLDDMTIALAELRRVLAPEGTLQVVGPDIDLALTHYPDDTALHESIRAGAPENRPGESHAWTATAAQTIELLEADGWSVVQIPIADAPDTWPVVSRIGWQFALEATPR